MKYDEAFVRSNLPGPLTQEELRYYFKKYKEGDMKAKDVIVEHNIKLVFNRVFTRFAEAPYEKKELVSSGLVGLVKGVNTFDISKNILFATYATKCIDNEILMFMRSKKKYNNDISIDMELKGDKDQYKIKFGDMFEDEKSNFVKNIKQEEVYSRMYQLIEELPENEKEIIIYYFGFGDVDKLSQRELAEKFEITQSCVSRIIKKIVYKIGVQLQKDGLIDSANVKTRKRVKKEII